ncbi:hypothetical protein EA187_18560 [Lujinxingia sediminis]|uniref:Phytase-like domain-containing protein n=1 Tax=Lujinxingia sediminis TaxID=2480984 RepID=A0ABY0CND3_9DELT|nr:hypothetical protein [Lujinxingia sediminis]RVU41475.1 hypothetical protein EA187_18560 [Lujinxingia sediminis]
MRASPHARQRLAVPLMTAILSGGAVLSGTPELRAEEEVCGGWEVGHQVAQINDARLAESSGLAAGWRNPEVLWTHNDSGDRARLFALTTSPSDETDASPILTELTLEGIENVDWEDVAIGPCAAGSDASCIYVADTGDNLKEREEVVIYRFEEPLLDDTPPTRLNLSEGISSQRFTYEGGPRDAEALLVDPQSAAIFIIEKVDEASSRVFELSGAFEDNAVIEAQPVATLTLAETLSFGRMVTAADVAPDGRSFSLRTYTHLYTYCAPGGALRQAFESEPQRRFVTPGTLQGEALTYARDGESIWLTSERLPAPLLRVSRADPSPRPVPADTDTASDSADLSEDAGSDTAENNRDAGDDDDLRDATDASRSTRSEGCSTLASAPSSGYVPGWILGLVMVAGLRDIFRRLATRTPLPMR